MGFQNADTLLTKLNSVLFGALGDVTSVVFRPSSGESSFWVKEIDGYTRAAKHRSMLQKQKVSNSAATDKHLWCEKMDENGEFFYDHAGYGETAWRLQPHHRFQVFQVFLPKGPLSINSCLFRLSNLRGLNKQVHPPIQVL